MGRQHQPHPAAAEAPQHPIATDGVRRRQLGKHGCAHLLAREIRLHVERDGASLRRSPGGVVVVGHGRSASPMVQDFFEGSAVATYSYASIIVDSQRARWSLDEVTAGLGAMDFTRPFLPDALVHVE